MHRFRSAWVDMFLHSQPVFMRTQVCSCVHVSVFQLKSAQVPPAHVCRILHTQLLSSICMALGKNPSLGIWTPSYVFHLFVILTSFFTILYSIVYPMSWLERLWRFPIDHLPNRRKKESLRPQVDSILEMCQLLDSKILKHHNCPGYPG